MDFLKFSIYCGKRTTCTFFFRNCAESNCKKYVQIRYCQPKSVLIPWFWLHVRKQLFWVKSIRTEKNKKQLLHLSRLCCHWIFGQVIPVEKCENHIFYHILVIQFRITFITRNLVNERSARCKEFCWQVLSFFFIRSYGTTVDNNVDKRIQ